MTAGGRWWKYYRLGNRATTSDNFGKSALLESHRDPKVNFKNPDWKVSDFPLSIGYRSSQFVISVQSLTNRSFGSPRKCQKDGEMCNMIVCGMETSLKRRSLAVLLNVMKRNHHRAEHRAVRCSTKLLHVAFVTVSTLALCCQLFGTLWTIRHEHSASLTERRKTSFGAFLHPHQRRFGRRG